MSTNVFCHFLEGHFQSGGSRNLPGLSVTLQHPCSQFILVLVESKLLNEFLLNETGMRKTLFVSMFLISAG